MKMCMKAARALCLCVALFPCPGRATPSENPDVLARRGTMKLGKGVEKPILHLNEPRGGWTASRMVTIEGRCTDPSADPILINLNGVRAYVRSEGGRFKRSFPAAKGKNNIVIECANAAGVARVVRTIDAQIAPVGFKVILTSDTDGVYTDLHIYEPGGVHVYWADTTSPTGGLFFLNKEGDMGDKPGYGPYLYVHPAPPLGTFRIDANYWPGGAVQHTLATLDLVLLEGTPQESRRRIRKPLARPGETVTLAYVTFRGNGQPPNIYVPNQDPLDAAPPEARPTPSPTPSPSPTPTPMNTLPSTGHRDGSDLRPLQDTTASLFPYLSPSDARRMRSAVVGLALEQGQAPSPAWDPGQRDCAGLVRFAFREALRKRSAQQRAALRLPPALPFPPVSDDARRTVFGGRAFTAAFWDIGFDARGVRRSGPFADAETLVAHNFLLKGRNIEVAEPGDLVVYKKSETASEPYHLMIFAGPGGGKTRAARVVYHTGAAGAAGQVRIVSVDDLMAAPDPEWIPIHTNPHFLGVFAWNRFPPMPQRQTRL